MKREEVEKRLKEKNIDVPTLANIIGTKVDTLNKQLDQDEIPDELLKKIEDAFSEKSPIFFGDNNEIASNNCSNEVVLKFLEIIERKDKENLALIDRINFLTDKLIVKP